jgi:peptidyl-prolyl cis-trans isomerase D
MGGAKSRDGAVVATVNGETIALREFKRSYLKMLEFYRKQMQGNMEESLVKGIKQGALDNLVNRKLIIDEAKKEGIVVGDSEVRDAIQSLSFFQVDGHFKEDIYYTFLNNQGLLPKDFEESTRDDILVNKIEKLVKNTVKVADQEVRDLVNRMEEKVKLNYLVFTEKQFVEKVEWKGEDIQSYFEANKEKFRIPEKRSAEYVFVSAEDFINKAMAAQDEIEDYYYDNIKEFQSPQEVRARHILIKFAQSKDGKISEEVAAKTKEKAESILKKITEGEDFAELAKKYSEDKASAQEGGDLGFFRKGTMVKQFEEAAFALKKGETSKPVMTSFGYHIIRADDVHEEKTESLEEARSKVTERIKKKKGMRRGNKQLEELLGGLMNQKDALENIAKQFSTKIRQTDSFSRLDGKVGELKNPSEIIREVFTLSSGEISSPVEVEGGFYLLRAKETSPSMIPPMEEIKKAVQSAYRLEAADKLCGQEVSKLQEELGGGKADLKKIGGNFNLPVLDSGSLNQRLLSAKFQLDREEIENLFRKKSGDSGYIHVSGNHYLYSIIGKEKPDESKFSEEKGKYKEALLEKKKDAIFTAWLEDLKKGANIKVNESMLN